MNKIKLFIVSLFAIGLVSSCGMAMVKLKNPASGEKPGLVMFMVYDAQDWGQQVLTKQMSAVKLSRLNESGKYESIPTTDAGLEPFGFTRYIMTELTPGVTYTFRGFTSGDSYENSYKTMSMDTTDPENVVKIKVKPGEIQFLGLIATHSMEDHFEIVDGADLFKKLKSRIYYVDAIQKDLFGEYEISQIGAYKRFLDLFIEKQDNGYWKDLAVKTRNRLN